MNITFTKVRYKNLLSYGDVFTEVDLDRKGTTLISGTNGTGKSTMVEALSFALYGKPHRKVTKPELVNSINNKGLLVEVEFTAGETQYLVRRGMKPNIFEIWKNGEMLDQNAATRDYQLYFENNILRINHKSFCQIVVLGKANYTPFMDLTPANRREVIEDLLDIGVFSTMNLLLKDKISENKNLVAENKIMVDSVKNKLESAIEHNESLTELKKLEAGKIKEKIKEQLELIESEKSNIEQTEEDIAQHIALISDKAQQKDKYDKSKTVRNDLANMARSLERDLSFYSEHDN
jgi:DNA repair exonuclease SbcCD ATPase subunit